MKKTLAAGVLGAAIISGSLLGTVPLAAVATAAPPNCNGSGQDFLDSLGGGFDGCPPAGATPQQQQGNRIQPTHICTWRARGVSETDIVDQLVEWNPRLITPNVEDWVRKAEEDYCPNMLVELARRPIW